MWLCISTNYVNNVEAFARVREKARDPPSPSSPQAVAMRVVLLLSLSLSLCSPTGAVRVGRAGGVLRGALWKRAPVGGALTVSLELSPALGLPESQLALLSMKLRKESNVASLWTGTLEQLEVVAREQASAKGDFPGPCPIVFQGELPEAQAALEAGAAAVVLEPSVLAQADALEGEVIWRISSVEQLPPILEAGRTDAFLVDSAVAAAILPELPGDALVIIAVNAMQPNAGEVMTCKDFAASGARSFLVRSACVGDEEDLPYAKFVVGGITSKMSSTFKIDGLTGAANGHFGTSGGSLRPKTVKGWKRLAL
eukprot:scaffold28689_cov30-Tisochrysis_lutea.AAC.1